MATRKLTDIAVYVLLADVVESAVVSPLQCGPKRLDTVGVHLIADILADAVLNSLVLEGKPAVALVIVGVDRRALPSLPTSLRHRPPLELL